MNYFFFRFESESKIVDIGNVSFAVVVNVTLTVANPLHISEQRTKMAVNMKKQNPFITSITEDESAEGTDEWTVQAANLPRYPSYSSLQEFDDKFKGFEQRSPAIAEKINSQLGSSISGTGSSLLKLTMEVRFFIKISVNLFILYNAFPFLSFKLFIGL